MVMPDGEILWLGARPDGGEEVGGYDLRGLVIGCEGMFGIVTRVLLQLIRAPQMYKTLLGVFEAWTTPARRSVTSSPPTWFPARWK